jgi:cation transport protein ChaC
MPALTHDLIARSVPPSPPGSAAPAFDEPRLRAEMKVFLHGRDPGLGIWVFAYDALMWKHDEARPDIVAPARLPGLARRYTLRDIHDRGTPDAPGLTLSLEKAPALACPGLLLHLPGPEVESRLWPVWRQAMGPGSHKPQWREATLHGGRAPGGPPVRALCFTTRHGHPLEVGEKPVGSVADILARASGPNGAAAAYLLDAAETLRRHGLRDAMLESLEAEVARRLADVPGGPGAATSAAPARSAG